MAARSGSRTMSLGSKRSSYSRRLKRALCRAAARPLEPLGRQAPRQIHHQRPQLCRIDAGAAHHRHHDVIAQQLFERRLRRHLPTPHFDLLASARLERLRPTLADLWQPMVILTARRRAVRLSNNYQHAPLVRSSIDFSYLQTGLPRSTWFGLVNAPPAAPAAPPSSAPAP